MNESVSAMVFANDLLIDFLDLCNERWRPLNGIDSLTDYKPEYKYSSSIAEAVYITYMENIKEIEACFREMKDEGIVTNHNDLARLALDVFPLYFECGSFVNQKFIAYCAIVMGVASFFHTETYDDGYFLSASGAVSTVLIGCILNGTFQKEGGWNTLPLVCSHIVDNYSIKKDRRRHTQEVISHSELT